MWIKKDELVFYSGNLKEMNISFSISSPNHSLYQIKDNPYLNIWLIDPFDNSVTTDPIKVIDLNETLETNPKKRKYSVLLGKNIKFQEGEYKILFKLDKYRGDGQGILFVQNINIIEVR